VKKDDDLVYDGRARKRPPGANSTVIQIFDLLDAHPDGLTLEAICARLRAGFPTDAYRAYEQNLKRRRQDDGGRSPRPPSSGLLPLRLEYGTPAFKQRAERWWIQGVLKHMREAGTAERRAALWYRVDRSPLVYGVCTECSRPQLVPYDSKKGRAEDEARVLRVNIREEARAVLNDKKVPLKARKAIEQLMGIS
jgi:hypothetical protein